LGGGRGSRGFGGAILARTALERIPNYVTGKPVEFRANLLQDGASGLELARIRTAREILGSTDMSRLTEEFQHLDAWMEQAPVSLVVLIGGVTGAMLALLYWAW